MVLNTINIHSAGKTARLCLAILLLLTSTPSSRVLGREQEIEKLNRFVQTSDASNASGQAFRKGRDLIEEEEWEEAAETFGDFIADYPKDKNVDAALYWRAFALKKQGRLQQVSENLNRLIKEYPRSRWITDAKAMQVEIAGKRGDTDAITRVLEDEDSPEDERKIIALQSLFQADPERAADYAGEMLKPGSKASRRLKDNVISLLGQQGSRRARAALSQIARASGDSKIRRNAIFWIGQTSDEEVLPLLKELAMSTGDDDVSKAAVFSLSQHRSAQAAQMLRDLAKNSASPKVRKEAIFWLGQRSDDASFNELSALFDTEQDPDIRKQVIFGLSQMSSQRAKDKLFEIARASNDPVAQREAIFWISQDHSDRSVDFLTQLYDGEQDADTKKKIIFALAQTQNRKGLRKIMEIAKGEANVQLRKDAIFWLGQSKDPEAMKFLEDILK